MVQWPPIIHVEGGIYIDKCVYVYIQDCMLLVNIYSSFDHFCAVYIILR